jgi:2-polyprenyl-6-hydroxyphenyl methylase / 3-demethylubiquinone-9 3-methyltransferase
MAANDKYLGGTDKWWPPTGGNRFLFKLNRLRFEYFDRFVPDWKGKKVLDVGCGGGYVCETLAGRGATVLGTDIMADALEQARAHAQEERLSIGYHLCTPGKFPFEDGSMDAVTCFDVLEHVEDKEPTLREIRRVLKPGGWFFFDTFSKTFWSRLILIWLGEIVVRFIERGTHYWPWFIRPDELAVMLEKIGFSGVEYGGIKRAPKALPKRSPPVTVTPGGNTSIIYFGSARRSS